MSTARPADRDDELERLETEVAELRKGAAGPPSGGATGRASLGRRFAVGLLVVLGCILAPVAGTAVWLNNQITDTDRYVRTVTPLASDPDIQAAVAANVTTALFQRVDIQAEAESALPPRAEFLAVPLARGVEQFTRDATLRVLESERFEQLWIEINRISHEQLVRLLTGEDGRAVQTSDGQVVLDLTPVLDAVKVELAERGITIFDRVPASAVATSFVLMESDELESAQRGLDLLNSLAVALPILVAVLLGAAVALSRNRRRTLLRAGLGVAAAMVVLGAGLTLARSVYVDAVAGPGLPEDAAISFYEIAVHWLRIGIRAIAAVALLVAIGAFLTGPSRLAQGTRSRFRAVVDGLMGGTGMRASPTGRWVGENRSALRVAAIFVPVLVFLLWDAPTPSVLVVLVALALLGLLAIELVGAGRDAEEVTEPAPGSDGAPEPG